MEHRRLSGISPPLVLLSAVAGGLAVSTVYFAQPLLDRIAADLAFSPAWAGTIVVATQAGYALGLLLIVPLGDLMDRRRLITAQFAVLTLALIGVGAARSHAMLLAAAALLGTMAVVAQSIVAAAASMATPQQRGKVVGTITSGIISGILLARTVAGPVSDLGGWRSVYFGSACCSLVLAILLYRAFPRSERNAEPRSYHRVILTVFELILQERVLRIRGFIAFLSFFGATVFLTPLILPLTSPPYSLSHSQAGLFGIAGAAGAIAARKAGRWSDNGYAQHTTLAGLALLLLCWLPASFLPLSLWGVALGLLLMDFGLQAVHVANQTLIYRSRPEVQSRLTAAYMLFYSAGSASGGIASTLVYDRAGWMGICLLGACGALFAMIVWAKTDRAEIAHLLTRPSETRQGSLPDYR